MNPEDFYKDKRILILGGAGFIGSNLAGALLDFGAKVDVIDGFVDGTGADIRNISGFADNIGLYRSRVEEFSRLPETVKAADLIIDCMALTSHNVGVENPIMDTQLNLMSHLHLINALKESKGKKIIYLGSRGQYGNAGDERITEDTPQDPIDPQGINKTAAEHYFKFYSKRFGFNVVSLRIANCFGENQKVAGDDPGLVGSFIKEAINDGTVVIYGSRERIKNLIYVKDLVKVITRIGTGDFSAFDPYNVSGIEVSLGTLLDSITGLTGKGNYVVKPFPDNIKRIDVGGSGFSGDKLSNKLAGIDLTDLNESLKNTIDHFKERLDEKE